MSNPATSDSTLKHVGDLSPELRVSPQLKPLSMGERFLKSRSIEKSIITDKMLYRKTSIEPKLLILGTSDSGKSTVIKQLKIMYGDPSNTEAEIENSKNNIRIQMIATCRTILKAMSDQGEPIPNDLQDLLDKKLLKEFQNSLEDHLDKARVLLERCWNNDAVQKTLKTLPSMYNLPETSKFYMMHTSRIFDPLYQPTEGDWLKLRMATTNICETVFKVSNNTLHCYDVSGVKAHRKYWISYFDDVTAILFVASLSSYNETMPDDDSTNRLMDSFVVFEHIVNNQAFQKTSIILFLNKKDLFEKKIKKISIKNYFPEYDGKLLSQSSGADFIKQKFRKLAHREIAAHATCAIDSSEMKSILESVLLKISRKALQTTGLIM